MDFKQFLELYLSTTLNLDKAGVAELFESDGTLKADAITQLAEKDKQRVKDLQKDKFDEGAKATKRTVMSEFEKQLKEKLGLKSDKQGVDLVLEAIAAKTSNGEKLTEEQVKQHKAYLDLQESLDAKIAEAVKAKDTEFETYKQDIERGKSLSVVKQKALALFEELKPVLSSNPKVAANQKELFLKQFEKGNYRLDGERIIMLDDKGNDVQDEHGKRVDFEAYVKKTASEHYDFQATEKKGSPGAGNDGGQGGGQGAAKKYSFKDAADFETQFLKTTDTKERIAMGQQWKEQQNTAQP